VKVENAVREARVVEKRILHDLTEGVVVLLVFACAVYFLDLLSSLADFLGWSVLREVDVATVIGLYAVWLLGIFILRRIHELRDAQHRRQRMELCLQDVQKIKSMRILAGGMTQEVNSLLTVVLGVTDLMVAENPDNPTIAEGAEAIRDASQQTGVWAKKIQSFVQFERRAPRPVDTNNLIAGLKTPILHRGGDKAHYHTSLAARRSTAFCDAVQLEQVMLSLVENAYDAMPDGGELRIESTNAVLEDPAAAQMGVQPGEFVVISVSDTGCGIDADALASVFDPFFSTKSGAPGLGLSVAMDIVRQAGGVITVESRPGHGSVFSVHLPVHADRAPAHAAQRPAVTEPESAFEAEVQPA
jgi:signal transduction histidine kinase